MDGAAHYRKAEELAAKAAEYLGQGDGQVAAGTWAAVAQVHATLAVAATFERTPKPPVLVTEPPATGNIGCSVSSAGHQNSDTRATCARPTHTRDHSRPAVTGM